METSEQKLLGSHLFIKRGMYSHHGIYIGNDEVIHYSGFQQKFMTGKISKVGFKDFSSGQQVFVRVYFGDRFLPIEVVRRAMSRVDENEYDLLFNNCEHFATWCVTDQEISSQVKAVVWPVTGVPRAIGRATVGWAFNMKDKYLDVRMKRYLRSYETIMNLVRSPIS